jgi:DNA polymerase-4
MAKSIGAETTFSVDTAEPKQIRQTLLSLAERVSSRLRHEGYAGHTITLKLRYADFTTLTRSLTLPEPVAFTEEIHSAVLSLLQKIPWRGRNIRLLGIAVSKLTDKASPGQVPLFPANPRGEKAAQAMDEIRRRFGEAGITRASLLSRRSRKEVR